MSLKQIETRLNTSSVLAQHYFLTNALTNNLVATNNVYCDRTYYPAFNAISNPYDHLKPYRSNVKYDAGVVQWISMINIVNHHWDGTTSLEAEVIKLQKDVHSMKERTKTIEIRVDRIVRFRLLTKASALLLTAVGVVSLACLFSINSLSTPLITGVGIGTLCAMLIHMEAIASNTLSKKVFLHSAAFLMLLEVVLFADYIVSHFSGLK